jgi:glycosyltransferase involved in cell wall biosynthesis
VDSDRPEQIAEAVKEILASPEQTAKVVANARKMVEEKYDWDAIAKDMRTRVFARLWSSQD